MKKAKFGVFQVSIVQLKQTFYFESIFCSCAKAGGGGYKSNYSNINKSSKKSATLMSY